MSTGIWTSGLCDPYFRASTKGCRFYFCPCYPYREILANMTAEETKEVRTHCDGVPLALECQSIMGFFVLGSGNAYSICCCFWLYCLRRCGGNESTGFYLSDLPVTGMEVTSCIVVPCVLAFAAPILVSIICPIHLICRLPLRTAIRKKYNIAGTESEDCRTLWCCSVCALKQVRNMNTESLQLPLFSI